MASFKAIGNFLSQNILNRTLWASAYISCVSDMASQSFVSLPLVSPSLPLSLSLLLSYITSCSFHSSQSTPTSVFPQIHSSSISIQKWAGLPGRAAKHSITRCHQARHKPHIKAGPGSPVGGRGPRSRSSEQMKESVLMFFPYYYSHSGLLKL